MNRDATSTDQRSSIQATQEKFIAAIPLEYESSDSEFYVAPIDSQSSIRMTPEEFAAAFPLDYQSPDAQPSFLFSVVGTAAIFAIVHIVTEWLTGYAVRYKCFQTIKFPSDFLVDMAIETGWAFFAAVVIVVVQLVYPRSRKNVLRRDVWWLALFCGVGYCWLRWGIWGIAHYFHINYPEQIDFQIAMTLAVLIGIAIAHFRVPGKKAS